MRKGERGEGRGEGEEKEKKREGGGKRGEREGKKGEKKRGKKKKREKKKKKKNFFFKDTASTEIYTLNRHDALQIMVSNDANIPQAANSRQTTTRRPATAKVLPAFWPTMELFFMFGRCSLTDQFVPEPIQVI